MTDAERALVGTEEIAAFVEQWWRTERGCRGVRVSARAVRRWLRRHEDPLPAGRIDTGGPWVSLPSEVSEWLRRHYAMSTESGHGGQDVQNAQ